MRLRMYALILLCWPSVAAAQPTQPTEEPEPIELTERLLPEYIACTVDGVRYACYTADQQLQLNVLEENARTWRRQLMLTEQLRLDQAALIENLTAQITESTEIRTAQAARIQEITTQLLNEIEAKNQYRAQAESIDWWPLLVGGVVGLLGAGVAIGVSIAAASGAFNNVTTSP